MALMDSRSWGGIDQQGFGVEVGAKGEEEV